MNEYCIHQCRYNTVKTVKSSSRTVSTGQKDNCPVKDIIGTDLKDIGLSWDEASELAHSGSSWLQRVAQCVFDTG